MMSPLGYAREGPALKGRVGFLLHALAETSESQPASTRRGGLECTWEGNLDVFHGMLKFAPFKDTSRGTEAHFPAARGPGGNGALEAGSGSNVVSIIAADPFALARAGIWQTACHWHSLG